MTGWVCVTCAAHYPPAPAPPRVCRICADERQYVPESGQAWMAASEVAASHRTVLRDEEELLAIGVEPKLGIGQRALLVPAAPAASSAPASPARVLWDCVPLVDHNAVAAVEAVGGLRAIAISHPHYYTAMAEWAERFDVPIHLHAADAEWITEPSDHVAPWEGDRLELGDGLTLLRLGGHFPGATVLHWAGGAGGEGALLVGDVLQVVPDRRFVSFMWSYPNYVPLPAARVRAMADALAPYRFETIYGAWWDAVVRRDGEDVVRRSADRYERALRGELPT